MWRRKSGILGFFFFVLACSAHHQPPPDSAALVGAEKITLQEVEHYFQQSLGKNPYGADPKVLSALFDQYIETYILSLLAKEKGFAYRSVFKQAEAFLSQLCQNLPPPKEDAVREYYRQHREGFSTPELFYLKQILTESKQDCQKARTWLEKGKTFEEVSMKMGKGLRLPALTLEDIPQELQDTVKQLKPGQFTSCQALGYGFLLLYLEKREPPHTYTFEEVRDKIQRVLKKEGCTRLKKRLIKNFTKENAVWVVQSNLPFPYSGRYPVYSPDHESS